MREGASCCGAAGGRGGGEKARVKMPHVEARSCCCHLFTIGTCQLLFEQNGCLLSKTAGTYTPPPARIRALAL